MNKKSIKYFLVILFLFSVFTGVFAPIQEIQAAPDAADTTAFGVNFLYGILTARSVVGVIFSTLSNLLSKVIKLATWQPPVVREVWTMTRNFVNMFFILVLIVMAFGTIFNIHHYTMKELFAPFLIAALMVNFSFTIGTYILDVSNSLVDVELETIKEGLGGDIWKLLSTKGMGGPLIASGGEGAKAIEKGLSAVVCGATLATAGVGKLAALGCARVITDLGLSIVFLGISVLAMAMVFFFVIARIPFIWMLLIISPVAWLGLTLPSTEGMWKWWWKQFLGWCFWMPAYMGILMMLAIILRAREEVSPESYVNAFNDPGISNYITIFFKVFGLNDLIFFLITMTFVVGGIWLSFKLGDFFGGSVKLGIGWAQGKVGKLPVPYANNNVRGVIAGATRFGKEGWADYQERGMEALPFKMPRFSNSTRLGRLGNKVSGALTPQGERAQREKDARAAQRLNNLLGMEAIHHAPEHAKEENIKKEMDRLKHANPAMTQADSDYGFTHTTNATEKLAWAKIRADRGWITQASPEAIADEVESGLKLLGGTHTEIGKEYLKNATQNLTKDATDDLMARLEGRDKLAVSLIRAQKAWIPENIDPTTGLPSAHGAGTDEIIETVQALGPDSAETQEYIKALNDTDFRGIFKNPGHKIDFANSIDLNTHPELANLKATTFMNAGKLNQLKDRKDLNTLMDLTKNASAETRTKVNEYAYNNLKSIAPTIEGRRKELISNSYKRDLITGDVILDPVTGQPEGYDEAAIITATSMINNAEVRDSEAAIQAIRILEAIPPGGSVDLRTVTHPKSVEMLASLQEKHPLLAQEMEVRKTFNYDGDLPLAPADVQRALVNAWRPKIMNPEIREKEIMKADLKTWDTDAYQQVVIEKAEALQNKKPSGKTRTGNRIPGGGEEFFDTMIEMAGGPDTVKGQIIAEAKGYAALP